MRGIVLRNLTKKIGERTLFAKVSLTLEDHGLVAILGESGSGKSTLLDLLAGLDDAYSGEILISDENLRNKSEDEKASFRLSHLGFVRQNDALLELENVLDNVLFPLASFAVSPLSARRKALDLLRWLGLEKKAKQKVNTLSGGERQRVALARALIIDPKIVLADEPTGALDKENAELILRTLQKIAKDRLVIIVSHDQVLVEKYAEQILFLRDATIYVSSQPPAIEPTSTIPLLKPAQESLSHIPLHRWFAHALRLLGAKKWRTLLSAFVVFFSLLSLGVSLYVSRDLKNEMDSAFSALTGEGTVVVERATGGDSLFGNVYAADERNVTDVIRTHPALAKGYGVSYLASFETFFPDGDEGSFESQGHIITIPNLTVRTIADFLWLEDNSSKPFYPAAPEVMEMDQVVLGLPYAALASLCFSLQILRTYESLGNYLAFRPLDLVFRVENADWGYSDEQLFSVVAITEDAVPTLYHENHLWNAYVLEERMRFPTSDVVDTTYPWILQKVFYLVPVSSPQQFVEASRQDPSLAPYVFERPSYDYERTHCEKGKVSFLPRLYVYLADKRSLDPAFLEKLSSDKDFCSFSAFGNGSYLALPQALASGFANPFYLSDDLLRLEEVVAASESVPLSETRKEPILPVGVHRGSYLYPRTSSLTFSSDFRKRSQGREPTGTEEICLSSRLDESLNHPAKVFVAGMVGSEAIGDKLVRDYRYAELKVVGVVEEDAEVLYGTSYWNVDFWRGVLGMSSFLAEPRSAAFFLKDPSSSEKTRKRLGALYPEYRFTDPAAEASSSSENIISFATLALGFSSFVALAICGILLVVVALLSSFENRREARMLFYLGVKREDIAEGYGASLFLLVGYCGTIAASLLFFLEIAIDKAIQGNFQTSRLFVLDPFPIVVVAFCAFLGFSFAFGLTRHWVQKRDFLAEGR